MYKRCFLKRGGLGVVNHVGVIKGEKSDRILHASCSLKSDETAQISKRLKITASLYVDPRFP